MTAIQRDGDTGRRVGHLVEPATAADEVPVYLPAGSEYVFGILTRPVVPANGTAILCLHAGAQNLTSHRNRVYTRLCREAAGAGYLAFRMDFHGAGDSSGVLQDRSVSGQTMADVDAAVHWLTEQGARGVVIVGTCWGGLVAAVAAARQEAITSACLISPPLHLIETGASATQGRTRHDRLSRALLVGLRPRVLKLLLIEGQYRRWVISRVRTRLAKRLASRFGARSAPLRRDDPASLSHGHLFTALLRRRVPIRVLFSEQDPTYLGLRRAGALPSLEAASEIIHMDVTPVAVHGLTTIRAQETVLRFVRECLAQEAGAAAPVA